MQYGLENLSCVMQTRQLVVLRRLLAQQIVRVACCLKYFLRFLEHRGKRIRFL